jgi:hypothetical protein
MAASPRSAARRSLLRRVPPRVLLLLALGAGALATALIAVFHGFASSSPSADASDVAGVGGRAPKGDAAVIISSARPRATFADLVDALWRKWIAGCSAEESVIRTALEERGFWCAGGAADATAASAPPTYCEVAELCIDDDRGVYIPADVLHGKEGESLVAAGAFFPLRLSALPADACPAGEGEPFRVPVLERHTRRRGVHFDPSTEKWDAIIDEAGITIHEAPALLGRFCRGSAEGGLPESALGAAGSAALAPLFATLLRMSRG